MITRLKSCCRPAPAPCASPWPTEVRQLTLLSDALSPCSAIDSSQWSSTVVLEQRKVVRIKQLLKHPNRIYTYHRNSACCSVKECSG